jgi:hypothetical protein
MHPRAQGDLGEASAIEWLAGAGARVYIPFGHSPDFVHVADGRRWFIPSRELGGATGIRLGGPKYAGFEVDRGRPFGPVRVDTG